MKRWLILALLGLTTAALGQEKPKVKFPFYLLPGDQFVVPSKYDTLWVLSHRNYKNAVKKSLKQPIDSSLASLYSQKVDLLQLIVQEKDSIIALNAEGFAHYQKLWEETDHKLEEEEIRSARNLRRGFYFGLGVSAATLLVLRAVFD